MNRCRACLHVLFLKNRLGQVLRLAWMMTILVAFSTLGGVGKAGAQSANCRSTTAPRYQVTVCFSNLMNGEVLSGTKQIQVSATVEGANPRIRRMVYYLDGTYLLTEFEAPYTFVLPTHQFEDGLHRLEVEAMMRDHLVTQRAAVDVVFRNGRVALQADELKFEPTSGRRAGAGERFIVAATGDAASDRRTAARVSDLIDSWSPNLFLYLGDVYDRGTGVEFYNWYGTPDRLFGRFRDVTNPAIGNHEYENGSAAGYFDYWDQVPDYYSYDAAGWHFISLNSTEQFGQTQPGTPQYDWLVADLAQNDAPCTVAYFHHPVFSIGQHGSEARLLPVWRVLYDQGVDIVLAGHDHNYQRWHPLNPWGQPNPRGITEFVVGSGGHGIRPFIRSDDRVALGFDKPRVSHGALKLVLNPRGAEFQYVNIAGTILDSGVVPCRGQVDLLPPAAPTGLVARVSSPYQVDLSWDPATDDTGVLGYILFRDGIELATVKGATTHYVDTAVSSAVSHEYTVLAFDPAGNRSALSESVVAATPATEMVVFVPVADAYVTTQWSQQNYGGQSYLRVDGSPLYRSYVQFDIQNLPGKIVRASLQVFGNADSNPGFDVRPALSNDWTEFGLTFENAPAMANQSRSSGPVRAGIWNTVDVTPFVPAEGRASLVLTTSGPASMRFASREMGSIAPRLLVELDRGAEPVAGRYVFTPVADAYVNEEDETRNYGRAEVLRVDSQPEYRTYLRFNVQGVTGKMARATLRIYAETPSTIGYEVHGAGTNTWDEWTLNYQNAPPAGPVVGMSVPFGGGVWTEVDVTPLMTAEGEVSLVLTSTDTTAIRLSSRESVETVPYLVIETVP